MATLPLLLSLLCVSALAAGGASAGSAVATSCRLTLAPFIYSPDASQHFLSGSVSTRLSVQNDTRTLVLCRSSKLQLDDVWVQDGQRNVSVNSSQFDEYTNTHVVTLSEELRAGRQYVVVVPMFRAEVKPIEYLETENKTKFAASSLGFETHDFVPLLDDDTGRVTVDVSIVRRSDFSAASNSESVGNRTEDNAASWWPDVDASEISGFSWTRETFATTSAIPMSSLQFVVSQMAQVAAVTDSKGRQHRFWSSEICAFACKMLARVAARTVATLEKKLGVLHPVNKVDYFLLLVNKSQSASQLAEFSVGIATLRLPVKPSRLSNGYELAVRGFIFLTLRIPEVWLGQIVRVSEDKSWMLDGIVSMASSDWSTEAPDSWQLLRLPRNDFWQDANCTADPAAAAASRSRTCRNSFKAASVFRQLRLFAGFEAFDSAIRDFAQAFAFKQPAPASALLGKLKLVSYTFEPYLHSWTKQPGAPIVTCSVRDDQLVLSQRPMRGNPNSTWAIPITMVTSDNATRRRNDEREPWTSVQWMTQQRQSFSSFNATQPPSWYLLNLRGVGLYRVNYDADNWAALGRLLRENHELLHPLERAALLEDSIELARLGMLDYSVPADIVRYVANETVAVGLLSLTEQLNSTLEQAETRAEGRRQLELLGVCRLQSELSDCIAASKRLRRDPTARRRRLLSADGELLSFLRENCASAA